MSQALPAYSSSQPSPYTKIKTRQLISIFDAAPYRLRQIVAGLSLSELKARPRPGKWSILEICLHLADAEIIGAARMRQTLSQSFRELPGYDQENWAHCFNYETAGHTDMDYALNLLESLRLTTSLILHRACPSDWSKTAIHPESGEISLRELLELYADHGERHFAQILELRKLLGRELEFPILLPDRLY